MCFDVAAQKKRGSDELRWFMYTRLPQLVRTKGWTDDESLYWLTVMLFIIAVKRSIEFSAHWQLFVNQMVVIIAKWCMCWRFLFMQALQFLFAQGHFIQCILYLLTECVAWRL